MDTNKKISVIIPVYNVEPYLARCLDSILSNTYQNLEIICVDDGSTDHGLEILRTYERADQRVRVITKVNGGVSSARNAGLDIATGEFIAFIDPDDWIHSCYFEVLMNAQSLNDADIAVCNYSRTSENSILHEPDISDASPRILTMDEFLQTKHVRFYVWGRIYRSTLLANHRFINGIIYEDTPYNIFLVCKHLNIRFSIIDIPLYYYFNRATSLVNTSNSLLHLIVCQKYLDYLETDPIDRVKSIMMEESIKKGLSSRYFATISKKRNAITTSNILLQKSLSIYLKSTASPFKKKIQFFLMVNIPALYRAFRIADDPTLLAWEKTLRENQNDHT